ncbi:hypothetical protein [Zavarzinella formosa]|uniref:hypothetical protein n=1 Tax=Zavarzinella formosa TaxID=360055 RepID=UPI0002F615AD|nr:hypothetical protein [Zavarzinella formosa]
MKDAELAMIDSRINALLPPVYRGCYSRVSPYSMSSTKLKYGPDGRVAWDDIWTTFCDLALAGGPPHRGKLLEFVTAKAIADDPARHHEVVEEIIRAIQLTTGLTAAGDSTGCVAVTCQTEAMAVWLQFAVVAENVSCRRKGCFLLLPAGPEFRVEKEIKNVTVALAKACHYWEGHISEDQQTTAGTFAVWEPATPSEAAESPVEYQTSVQMVSSGIGEATGLPVETRSTGWVEIDADGSDAAVWMLRAIVACGVLTRREDGRLCLPVGYPADPVKSNHVARTFSSVWRLWKLHEAGE